MTQGELTPLQIAVEHLEELSSIVAEAHRRGDKQGNGRELATVLRGALQKARTALNSLSFLDLEDDDITEVPE